MYIKNLSFKDYLEQTKSKIEEVKQKFDEMSVCYEKCQSLCENTKPREYKITNDEKNKENELRNCLTASIVEFQKAAKELSNL